MCCESGRRGGGAPEEEFNMSDLDTFLADPPRTFNLDPITERDRLDERVSIINVVFNFTVGMNLGYLERCPNHDPPSNDETLGWIWVLRPDLADEILTRTADGFFVRVVQRYRKTPIERYREASDRGGSQVD